MHLCLLCCLLVYFLLRSKSREIFSPLTKYGDDDDDVGTPADVVAGGGDVAGGVGRRLETVRGQEDGQGAAAAVPQAEDAADQGRRGRVRGLPTRTGKEETI